MLGLPIRSVIEPKEPVTAPPRTSVRDAARIMKTGNVGALLIVADGQLVGIFTERDALFRVMAVDQDPQRVQVADVMTRNPKTVSIDETFGYALLLMYENGFRHLPVLENGRPVAVLSARHALDPDLEEFSVEAARRKAIRRKA